MRYTPGETSELLNIPSSTIRRYVQTFSPYLSTSAQKKKSRMFSDEDIATLSRVRDLAADGILMRDIAAQLEQVVDKDQPEEEPPTSTIVIFQQRFAAYDAELDQMKQEQKAMQDQIAQLRAELDTARLPWYKKLRKRP